MSAIELDLPKTCHLGPFLQPSTREPDIQNPLRQLPNDLKETNAAVVAARALRYKDNNSEQYPLRDSRSPAHPSIAGLLGYLLKLLVCGRCVREPRALGAAGDAVARRGALPVEIHPLARLVLQRVVTRLGGRRVALLVSGTQGEAGLPPVAVFQGGHDGVVCLK